jgi:uncharacterized NAD(P)/FAD-binding protein YdhS
MKRTLLIICFSGLLLFPAFAEIAVFEDFSMQNIAAIFASLDKENKYTEQTVIDNVTGKSANLLLMRRSVPLHRANACIFATIHKSRNIHILSFSGAL